MKFALFVSEVLSAVSGWLFIHTTKMVRPCRKCIFYTKEWGYCHKGGISVSVLKRRMRKQCYYFTKK